jgi:FixJ family two-component response regulator
MVPSACEIHNRLMDLKQNTSIMALAGHTKVCMLLQTLRGGPTP